MCIVCHSVFSVWQYKYTHHLSLHDTMALCVRLSFCLRCNMVDRVSCIQLLLFAGIKTILKKGTSQHILYFFCDIYCEMKTYIHESSPSRVVQGHALLEVIIVHFKGTCIKLLHFESKINRLDLLSALLNNLIKNTLIVKIGYYYPVHVQLSIMDISVDVKGV